MRPRPRQQIPKGAYIPFGGGSRTCIGMRFGQLEVRTIATLIARDFTLELPRDFKLSYRQMPTISPREGMPMTVHERQARRAYNGQAVALSRQARIGWRQQVVASGCAAPAQPPSSTLKWVSLKSVTVPRLASGKPCGSATSRPSNGLTSAVIDACTPNRPPEARASTSPPPLAVGSMLKAAGQRFVELLLGQRGARADRRAMLLHAQVADLEPAGRSGTAVSVAASALTVIEPTVARFPQERGDLRDRHRQAAGGDADRVGFAPQQLDGREGADADAAHRPVTSHAVAHAPGSQRRQEDLRQHDEQHESATTHAPRYTIRRRCTPPPSLQLRTQEVPTA